MTSAGRHADRLEGRRVLVTGAGGGQGRAVARRLLDEGARVALTDVALDALERVASDLCVGTAIPLCPADVRDERQVAHAVEHVVGELGGLDGLYNNAGVYLHQRDAPVDRLELGVWNDVLAINATGAYLFCKCAMPALLRARGVVVNVSSTAGHAGDADCHAYAASKGALIALTQSIARRWGPDGLRAVTLCPGFVETPMVDFIVDDEAVSAQVRAATALGRFGDPSEIAAAAAFLLSDDASFVTACTVDVHGGLVK